MGGTQRTAQRSRRQTPPHVFARRTTSVVGLICSAVAWVAAGPKGLVSGLLATLLVVAFFWSGLVPIYVTRALDAKVGIGLGVLLLTYTLRIALIVLVLRLAARSESLDGRWLGVTLIACALTWTAVHVAVVVRTS
jgi:hypothetical protein